MAVLSLIILLFGVFFILLFLNVPIFVSLAISSIIGVLVMMLTINLFMTGVSLVIIPLAFVLIAVVVKASQRYFKQQQDYLGHVNGHVNG